MKMDFWEKTNYTDGVPETYTKQLREKKMCDFWVYMPFKDQISMYHVHLADFCNRPANMLSPQELTKRVVLTIKRNNFTASAHGENFAVY